VLWTVRVGDRATTVAREGTAVYTFDLEGRPVSWWEAERTYKRSLASEVHETRRINGRTIRTLPEIEAAERFEKIVDRARKARNAIDDEEARKRLDRILEWTPESLLEERERFAAAYSPIAILPPDQYLSIVLQATFGCTWNRCTFCTFYQDRPFRLRSEEEFAEHARKVAEFLGRGAALRSWVFLADGNALALSTERLVPILRVACDSFAGRPVAGFVDVFAGARKSVRAWRRLREEGLARVHLGIETGHDPLLEWMEKPSRSEDAVGMVRELKAAGLEIAPIFLVGPGGRHFADAHVLDTLRIVRDFPLGPGDRVYLSPFVSHEGSAYEERSRRDGIVPLAPDALDAQYALLRDGVLATHPGVKVARYDLREYLY
jgi:radical SAM superfamily enzyme YgiQ (UPF0313 family)